MPTKTKAPTEHIPYVPTKKPPKIKGTQTATVLSIPKLNIALMEITLIGDSPLVVHRWSEKAQAMIAAKQAKKPKQAKEARDPKAEYEAALYKFPNGKFGFPSIGFKASAIDACSHIDGITKVEARGAFHIPGELVPIKGTPKMRTDMVRIAMGTADLRYRPEFEHWSTKFTVRYNTNKITPEQIAHLFNTAGFAVGVGEHRPQKDGMWGMFHVATEKEV